MVAVRPQAGNLAFAVFAVAWGLSLVPNNLVTATTSPLATTALAAETLLLIVATVGLTLLARRSPRPLDDRDRATWWAIALIWGVSMSAVILFTVLQPTTKAGLSVAAARWFDLRTVTTSAFLGALWGLLMLLAVRTRRWALDGEDGAAQNGRLMAIALIPYGGAIAAVYLFSPPNGTLIDNVLSLAWVAVILVLWGAAAGVRRGRSHAFVVLVVWCAALAVGAAYQASSSVAADRLTNTSPMWGATRFLAGGVLAYAIVRNQLFGIDLKIKWTLNRGTLAGVFIAAFFVVTVVAENFLTDRYGWAVGGVGAGLLLFALAPLQRFADRVADAAMPHVRDSEEYRTVRRQELYEAAVRSALRDGTITDAERDVLATLQHELGIPAPEALTIERRNVREVD